MDGQKSIIELFQENELRVSELYKIYSQKIPDHKNFWKKLSGEEIGHADDIAAIYGDKNQDYFAENKFARGVIKYVSGFVEEKIKEAKEKKMTHADAINIALRIEQSMLEKKCFDMFIPTNTTVKQVMKKLNEDTERHAEQLRKELDKLK